MEKMSKFRLGLISLLSMLILGLAFAQDTYVKVTSEDQLVDGGKYLIVCETANKAMTYADTKYRHTCDIVVNDATISTPVASSASDEENPRLITFHKISDNVWTLEDELDGKFLVHASGTTMNNTTTAFNWTVSIVSGDAQIISSSDAGRAIKYNGDFLRFTTYSTGDSKYPFCQLYKKQDPASVCDEPTALSAVPGAASVKLSWTAPVNAPANGYEIILTPDAGGESITENTPAGTTNIDVTGLAEKTGYAWTVASVCGDEIKSEAVSGTPFTTLPTTEPAVSPAENTLDETILVDAGWNKNLSFSAANLTTDLSLSIVAKDGQAQTVFSTETESIVQSETSFEIALEVQKDVAVGTYQDTLLISHNGTVLSKTVLNLTVNKHNMPKVGIQPQGGFFLNKTGVILSCPLENAEIRYTTNGDTPDAESTLYNGTFDLESNTTLKALAFPGAANEAKYQTVNDSIAIAEFTIQTITPAQLPFTFTGDQKDIASTSGLYDGGLETDGYGNSANLKFKNEGSFLLAHFSDIPGTLVYYIKGNVTNSSCIFEIDASSDGILWNNMVRYDASNTIPTDENAKEVRVENIPADARYIRWIYTKKGAGNVGIGNITIYKQTTDPILNIPAVLNIASTEVGKTRTGSAKITAKNLTEALTVTILEGSEVFETTPASISAEDAMRAEGDTLFITYKPTETGKDTALIEIGNSQIKDTLTVYATALQLETVETIKDFYAYYDQVDENQEFTFSGKAVVTHLDENIYNGKTTQRVWLQDTNMEKGASILVYAQNQEFGYESLAVGDVVSGFNGTLKVYGNLLELIPTSTLQAVSHGHALHIDTLGISQILSDKAGYQSRLVRLEKVNFAATGTFAAGKSYDLAQGENTIIFRTDYRAADYIGSDIPGEKMDIVGIVTQYFNDMQFTARSSADMTPSPCELPYNIQTSVTASTADITFEGEAAEYAYRYSADKDQLETAGTDTVQQKSIALTGLDAETKYYFQLKSLCSKASQSGWTVVDSFTTLSATAPALALTCPKADSVFKGEVTLAYTVENFELGKDKDGFVKIDISSQETVYTDQPSYSLSLLSSDYSVSVELVDADSLALESPVRVPARQFSVDLPDAAAPVFTPSDDEIHMDSVEVSLSCATDGATILYSTDGSMPSTVYTESFVLRESATVKALAFKAGMDTSALVSVSYNVRETVTIEGELVFSENFAKMGGSFNSSNDISEELDEYTELPGWDGSKIYPVGGLVRIGSSKEKGFLTTPEIDLSNNEGVFYLSFYAMAWNNDPSSISLTVGDQVVEVEGLKNAGATPDINNMSQFIYKFENGSPYTTISFSGIENKNRFFLDSIEVFQVLPEESMFVGLPESLKLETVKGVSISKEVTVKGRLLSENVSLASSSENITLSVAELDKEEVMREAGAKFALTFNAEVLADTASVTLVSGDVKDTILVYASAEDIVEVADLSQLRKGEEGKLYKVNAEVVLTAMDSYRNYKFVQDDHAGILIDDNTGLVTTEYEVGDGITGIYGRLTDFKGQLQLAMVGNLPEASSQDNEIEPIELSISELKENTEKYCSRVVRINGLSMIEATEWISNEDHLAIAGNDTVNIRTFVRNGDYIGDTIPAEFDLIAIAGVYDGLAQVSPRFKSDIIDVNDPGEDTTVNNAALAAEIASRIYPNPNNGEFTVETDQDAHADIFNAAGLRVKTLVLPAGKHTVRLHQSGIYFVRFYNNKATGVKRVIVR